MRTKNSYHLPVNLKKVTNIEYASESHQGDLRYSIDYDAPVGTAIYAALDGLVVAVKNDSKIGGIDKIFEDQANYVEILHSNNEVSEYEHLKFGSVKVSVGDRVKVKQMIARIGNTGWSACPHLHFMVYPVKQKYKTLQIIFTNKK